MFALRRALTSQSRMMLVTPVRTMSYTGKKFDDKQKGDEKAYFSKQDAKLLKNLVEKMEKRGELESDKKEQHDAVCDDLDAIFSSHGLDKSKDSLLYQELMEWKRHEH